MSGWLIASVTLLVFDSTRLRARQLVIGSLVTAALSLVVLLSGIGSGLLDGLGLENNQTDRVSFFKTLEASDDAALERKDVAAKAWGMFVDKPLLGHGLASTIRWADRSSTHNMFLSLMADHGTLGAFILPALLICVILGRSTSPQGSHWAFCAFTLWYALFSHNILGELYYLVGYAFFAMGGTAEGSAVASRPPSTPLSLTRPGADSFSPIVVAQ
jgi:O-antigen ligase